MFCGGLHQGLCHVPPQARGFSGQTSDVSRVQNASGNDAESATFWPIGGPKIVIFINLSRTVGHNPPILESGSPKTQSDSKTKTPGAGRREIPEIPSADIGCATPVTVPDRFATPIPPSENVRLPRAHPCCCCAYRWPGRVCGRHLPDFLHPMPSSAPCPTFRMGKPKTKRITTRA